MIDLATDDVNSFRDIDPDINYFDDLFFGLGQPIQSNYYTVDQMNVLSEGLASDL